MESFPNIQHCKDYGYYKWSPIEKDHMDFTVGDIMDGLGGSVEDPVQLPKVNNDLFKSG